MSDKKISELISANEVNPTDTLLVVQENVTKKVKVEKLLKKIENSYIGDEYNSTQTYAVGDYCIHDNTLYKCTTEIVIAEEWNAEHWTAVTIKDELDKKFDKNNIVDNLNSTSETDALSANQGKVLNERIQTLAPTVLYRNSTGTSGTVNLSDDVANYEHIEISFRVGQTQKSVIWKKHSTRPYAQLDFVEFSDGYLKFYTKTVQVSGTTITNVSFKKYTIQDSSTWTPYGSNDNEINIIAVIGYKY